MALPRQRGAGYGSRAPSLSGRRERYQEGGSASTDVVHESVVEPRSLSRVPGERLTMGFTDSDEIGNDSGHVACENYANQADSHEWRQSRLVGMTTAALPLASCIPQAYRFRLSQ